MQCATISGTWQAAIAAWVAYAQCQGSASTTLRTRREHLERLARSLGGDPWAVEADQLLAWFNGQRWATETRRGHRSTYREFWGWACEVGHVTSSAAVALPAIRPAPARPRPTPDAAYRLALATATERDRLMLRLSAEAGLRRAEVAQVHTDDLLEDLLGWSLLVHGKGGRDRVVPLPASLAAELRRSLSDHARYLFPGRDNGHLSPRWVGKVVGRLLPDGVTMHSNRHRFATRAYGVDRDLAVVQELLGHANINTTRAYVAVEKAELRRTVEAAA